MATTATAATAQQLFADAHSIGGDELRDHSSTELYAAAELAVSSGDAKAALRLAYYAGMAAVLEDL